MGQPACSIHRCVTDRRLPACCRCSSVFVLPSLYEGCGLTAREAIVHGVPTACSGAGELLEFCEEAATMFDLRSVEAIHRILTDTALRQRLSLAGTERAHEFSWQRTAQLTLEAYTKALA